MKKKLMGAMAIVAIAAMAAFNLNINAGNENLSAISMDNVEILAWGEEAGITCHRYAEAGRWNVCWIWVNGTCAFEGHQSNSCYLW